jgi:hypothetical protein
MKPLQPNTKFTRSSQPSRSRQQTPIIIKIDSDSSTESDSDRIDTSLESQPDDYNSAYSPSPPENQLGLDDWNLRRSRCLHNIQEVPEEPTGESQLFEGTHLMLTPNLEKIDCREVNQNEPAEKDDIPVDAEMFSSSDGQVSIFV